MDRIDRTDIGENSSERDTERNRELERHADERDRNLDQDEANPPRTSTGRMTAPKFGSATSGGGEIEPGPERD